MEANRPYPPNAQYGFNWSPPAQSNETTNGYFLERSQTARITLAKAFELCPDEDVEDPEVSEEDESQPPAETNKPPKETWQQPETTTNPPTHPSPPPSTTDPGSPQLHNPNYRTEVEEQSSEVVFDRPFQFDRTPFNTKVFHKRITLSKSEARRIEQEKEPASESADKLCAELAKLVRKKKARDDANKDTKDEENDP